MPKKNDDKAVEQTQHVDERFVATEGKLTTMLEERMGEMMRMMASGFEKLELRKVNQTGEKDRREGGPISSSCYPTQSTLSSLRCIGEKDRERRSWRNLRACQVLDPRREQDTKRVPSSINHPHGERRRKRSTRWLGR